MQFVGDEIRSTSKRVYFRCTRRDTANCFGRASACQNGRGWRVTRGHNHPPDPLYVAEKNLRRMILEEVRNNPLRPFRLLLSNFLIRNNVPLDLRARLRLPSLRQAMRRAKIEKYPNVPASLTELGEVLASEEYRDISCTADGMDNLFSGSFGRENEGTKCIIFISNRMKAYLQNVKSVFGDGTFDSRFLHPECRQIYNICTTRMNHVICLARIIMQSKTEDCYFVALSALRRLVPEFDPVTIMCDSEDAQKNAWSRVYPLAQLLSCLWHYVVNITRKAVSLGLKPIIDHNEEVDSIVRSLCALPLLPTHLILRGLIQLGQEANEFGLMGVLGPLFQYMENEWVPKIDVLSVCGRPDRTNNVCESDNRILSKEVGLPHPGVFQLIGAFVNLEDRFLTDLHTMDLGWNPGGKRKVSVLANDERIRAFTQSLMNNEITPLNFLHRASRRVQNVYNIGLNLGYQ